MVIGLYLKPKTIKLSEENVVESFCDLVLGKKIF